MSKIRSIQIKDIGWLVLIICWIFISGCTIYPIHVEDLKIDAPSGLKIPVDAYVNIELISSEYDERPLYDHTAELTALGVFRRVFTNVEIRSDVTNHLVVKLQRDIGEGRFSTLNVSVDVNCNVETNTGDLIGEYRASGSSYGGDPTSQPGSYTIALENAYKQAFAKILSKLLNDKKFQKLLDEGYFDTPP